MTTLVQLRTHLLNAARRPNHNCGLLLLQGLLLLLNWESTKKVAYLNPAHARAKALKLVANLCKLEFASTNVKTAWSTILKTKAHLEGKLTGVAQNNG